MNKKVKIAIGLISAFIIITYFTGFRLGTLLPFLISLIAIYFYTPKNDSLNESNEPNTSSLNKKG